MKKQVTSFILILALVITMTPMAGITAFAANSASPAVIDVSDNSGTNLPSGVTYTSGGGIGVFTVSTNGSITVTGTTTINTIAVTNGAILTLVLSGASITAPAGSPYSPIDLQGSANVTLQLADGTTNTASAVNAANRAGIRVTSAGGIGATLAITGTGSLNVWGNSSQGGAGIGGSATGENGGIITISSGTVNATGGYGAGIGGGGHSSGKYGAGGNITISGGTVNATGGTYGAGIGGGGNGPGAGGIINISGSANVTATGGANGAGIGGGGTGAGGTINISGSANVTATGGNNTAGIGGGGNGPSGNITINGGTVNATSGSGGAGIGGGWSDTVEGGTITINGGTVTAKSVDSGAGIGGGGMKSVGNIIITGGIVNATGGANGAGIGGGGSTGMSGAGAGGTILISGGTVHAAGGGKGAGIGGGVGFNGITSTDVLGAGGSITISPAAIVTAVSNGAGNPAIHAVGGSGSIINAKLDNAISSGSNTYLKCSGNALKLPANYKDFAFNAAADSPISAWSDPACTVSISDIITTPGGVVSIPLSTTIGAIPTSVTLAPTYALSVNLNGGNGPTGNGSHASGAAVSINAGTKSGYTFTNWTSSNGGTFGNASSAATTFTMPGNAATITATWTQDSIGGGGGGGGGSHSSPGTNITIDNENYFIGDEIKDGSDTTVTVGQNKFDDGIAKSSDNSRVVIPITENANVTARLVVKNIEDMAKKDMTLTVQTGRISYNINTSAVDTEKITSALGMTDTSKIPFDVTIANSSAVVNGTTMVVSPVEFTITAAYNGKTVNVDKFSSFVGRTIEITADQAKKITTGVVVEPNGSLRHVPTKVTVIGGKYYAVINSLTNSIYTVIWNPIEFNDVTIHWAKETVNDMGSRMVIRGVGQSDFEPDRDITRAEFAAIVIRALGLAPGEGASRFSDVSTTDWYCGYVKTAAESGIITGYDAATFGPSDRITREQAMTMIARAMKITGLKSEMNDSERISLLSNFSDGTAASDYAKTSITACLKTGVISGRTSDTIAPKNYITRAEVAVIVQRLLQKSDLI